MSQFGCPLCGAARAEPDGEMVWVRCRACAAIIFWPSDGPIVLVAHESDTIAQQIGAVLLSTGFAPVRVLYGHQAIRVLRERGASAAVVDVALTDIMAFQLVEQIRTSDDLRDVKVILVASVFNKTAYKRRPATLYGADDYVEQHHIYDFLPEKLAELTGRPAPETSLPGPEVRQQLRDDEARTDLAGAERVLALARSIVADIALYHEAEVQSFLHGGALSPLETVIAEGRRLLTEMANVEDY
ncbi:hypothetical protein ACFL6C_12395, partial [Myxococcota bacterium]